VLKAGEMKDVGNPYREMTSREKMYLQTMLDDIYMQFVEDVSKARNIARDSLVPIADGRIFSGRQALKIGLIDTLGGYEDAVSYLKGYLGIPEKSPIVEKKTRDGWLKRLIYTELFDKFPLLRRAASPAGSYYLFDLPIN
jgi:protease-4